MNKNKLLKHAALIMLQVILSAGVFAQTSPLPKHWDKRFGGTSYDYFRSLQQTTDGGYILGGYTYSGIGGDKTEASRGSYDYWIVKIDANGAKQWDKRFGGTDYDQFTSLQQTRDGGYILGGLSYSGISGDKTEANRGTQYTADYWVVKIVPMV